MRQRAERVRGAAAEQRARLLGAECTREQRRGHRRRQSEAHEPERVARHVQHRAHDVLAQRGEPLDGEPNMRCHARPSSPSPAAVSAIDRTITPGAPVVERVGEVDLGPAPLKAVALETELVQRRRADRHRVDGGAVVVQQSRKRQFARPGAAADRRLGLQHGHLHARAREHRGARQPVRAGPDDDRLAQLGTTAPRGRSVLGPMTSTGNAPVSSSHGWRSTMSATWT